MLDIKHIRLHDLGWFALLLCATLYFHHHHDQKFTGSSPPPPPPPYDPGSISFAQHNASMAQLARVIASQEAQVQSYRTQVRDLRGVLTMVQAEYAALLKQFDETNEESYNNNNNI